MNPLPTPTRVRGAMRTIAADKELNGGVLAMKDRAGEFESAEAATLAGIAMVPKARTALEDAMDAMWARELTRANFPTRGFDEVIIGGGLHAAIYCAVRARMGYRAPLVLEASERVGGTFAMSRAATFYLNSRNRPGAISFPGEGGALNVLPGAVLQPSMLSASEYQRNSDLGFVVRVTLASAANVAVGCEVIGVEENTTPSRRYRVILADGRVVLADRVLGARGLGLPRGRNQTTERILTFPQLMAQMDTAFPLRGMGRVAVVGGGDSGKTAVEALTGQGPSEHWSIPALDWVEEIDWYGRGLPFNCETWQDTQRTRYKRIGSLLPRTASDSERRRVRVLRARGTVAPGFECAYVNDRPYDLVVVCTGFRRKRLSWPDGSRSYYAGSEETHPLALQRGPVGSELFLIGPNANLPLSEAEENAGIGRIEDNRTALFRLAGRTATLARVLSGSGAERPTARTTRKRRQRRDDSERGGLELVSNKQGLTLRKLGLEYGDQFTIQRASGNEDIVTYTDYRPPFYYNGWRNSRVPVRVSARVLERLRKSPVLAYDSEGRTLREGDRAQVVDVGYSAVDGYQGVVDRVQPELARSYPFALKRDDGVLGGGPNGAFLISPGSTVVKQEAR